MWISSPIPRKPNSSVTPADAPPFTLPRAIHITRFHELCSRPGVLPRLPSLTPESDKLEPKQLYEFDSDLNDSNLGRSGPRRICSMVGLESLG